MLTTKRLLPTSLAILSAALVLGCRDSSGPPAPTGTLEIRVATAGALEDLPSAYNLNIDYVNGPDIGVNNSVAIPRLWRGQHVVYLDVASNCSVAGENPRWAEVVDGTEASVLAFSVTCTTKPPSNSPWDNY